MRHTRLAILLLVVLAAAAGFGPPSGRPPIGALAREDPEVYDFTFEVALDTAHQKFGHLKRSYNLDDAPIVVPLIFQNSFSQIDHESLKVRLWLGADEDAGVSQRARLEEDAPHHMNLAIFTVPAFTGQALRWQLTYRVMVWSSVIDDAAAARVAWPQTFPDEVADGLRPQMYIESDHEVFRSAVESVSEGNLRMVPPYLAAKDLVRYCITNIQVRGDGVRRGRFEALRGLELKGALRTVRDGWGSPHDLVCVCVAMLRAAGIPARPVIGVEERHNNPNTFDSWAEFYLPETGWIPFDPDELRGKGIRHKDVREPWSTFGTIDYLNERIPLSFYFMPPTGVETPQYPAVWGWDPRPGRDPGTEQQIRFTVVSRPTPQQQ